jgi:hypothetical protein
MAVLLSETQHDLCRIAIMPVELVRFRSVAEACRLMSTVLPLIVAVADAVSEAERDELEEFAQACGAEVVEVEASPQAVPFTIRMNQALTRAERRRFKIA